MCAAGYSPTAAAAVDVVGWPQNPCRKELGSSLHAILLGAHSDVMFGWLEARSQALRHESSTPPLFAGGTPNDIET